MSILLNPAMSAQQEADIDTLARTLWGEAHDDPVRSKEAIAAVILNRMQQARDRFGRDWWGGSVVDACLSGDLIRCWRDSPTARQDLLQVPDHDPVLVICRRIATRAVRNALFDPTQGATHYRIAGEVPPWLGRHVPTAAIGRHFFYRIA